MREAWFSEQREGWQNEVRVGQGQRAARLLGGPPISAGPIPAPIVQLLGRFVQLSMWSREAKSEKLFHTVLPLSCF